MVFVACGGKEPVDPTPTPGPGPDPKPPVETKDTKAPTITVKITEKNVIAGVVVSEKDNQLFFDQDVAATWTDDISKSCKVELSLVPSSGQAKTINSGDKLEEAGTLQIKVLDEAGNSSSAEIKLTLSDTKAPEIEIKISEKNVVAGVKISVQNNQLFFDQDIAASWKDDYSENCKVEITLVPEEGESKAVNSGDTIKEVGKLLILVQDDYENKATAEITLTKNDSQAPTITVLIQEKNVITGVKVLIDGNQLLFNEQVAASWTDDFSETCAVRLSKDCQPINSGDIILEAGKLFLTVADDFQNEATTEITLKAEAIYGLEGLKNLSLQVDNEVNLLQGITYADGVSLDKVEIEAQGMRVVVEDPAHYVPQTPGTIGIIITVKAGSRSLEFRADNLMVKGLDYNAPKMTTVDVIGEKYSWYNTLRPKKQEFLYDHILISYVAMEWCKVDNMEFIIFGELTKNIDCENVGYDVPTIHTQHGDRAYR